MLVADPSLGQKYYTPSPESDAAFTGGPDFSTEAQKRFDSVAALCQNAGYRVLRIPVVPAAAGRMFMTYVNVILDRSPDNKPIVYMSSLRPTSPPQHRRRPGLDLTGLPGPPHRLLLRLGKRRHSPLPRQRLLQIAAPQATIPERKPPAPVPSRAPMTNQIY